MALHVDPPRSGRLQEEDSFETSFAEQPLDWATERTYVLSELAMLKKRSQSTEDLVELVREELEQERAHWAGQFSTDSRPYQTLEKTADVDLRCLDREVYSGQDRDSRVLRDLESADSVAEAGASSSYVAGSVELLEGRLKRLAGVPASPAVSARTVQSPELAKSADWPATHAALEPVSMRTPRGDAHWHQLLSLLQRRVDETTREAISMRADIDRLFLSVGELQAAQDVTKLRSKTDELRQLVHEIADESCAQSEKLEEVEQKAEHAREVARNTAKIVNSIELEVTQRCKKEILDLRVRLEKANSELSHRIEDVSLRADVAFSGDLKNHMGKTLLGLASRVNAISQSHSAPSPTLTAMSHPSVSATSSCVLSTKGSEFWEDGPPCPGTGVVKLCTQSSDSMRLLEGSRCLSTDLPRSRVASSSWRVSTANAISHNQECPSPTLTAASQHPSAESPTSSCVLSTKGSEFWEDVPQAQTQVSTAGASLSLQNDKCQSLRRLQGSRSLSTDLLSRARVAASFRHGLLMAHKENEEPDQPLIRNRQWCAPPACSPAVILTRATATAMKTDLFTFEETATRLSDLKKSSAETNRATP